MYLIKEAEERNIKQFEKRLNVFYNEYIAPRAEDLNQIFKKYKIGNTILNVFFYYTILGFVFVSFGFLFYSPFFIVYAALGGDLMDLIMAFSFFFYLLIIGKSRLAILTKGKPRGKKSHKERLLKRLSLRVEGHIDKILCPRKLYYFLSTIFLGLLVTVTLFDDKDLYVSFTNYSIVLTPKVIALIPFTLTYLWIEHIIYKLLCVPRAVIFTDHLLIRGFCRPDVRIKWVDIKTSYVKRFVSTDEYGGKTFTYCLIINIKGR